MTEKERILKMLDDALIAAQAEERRIYANMIQHEDWTNEYVAIAVDEYYPIQSCVRHISAAISNYE